MDATIRYPLPDISLDPGDRIWIYGTGEIAREYYEQIVSRYGPEPVKGFINTFGLPSTFMGKKVMAATDLEADPKDKFLIASKAHADIMAGMLFQRGVKYERMICRPDWLHFDKWDGRPVLIYQFGKVGSTSLYYSLQRLNREVYHIHILEAGRLANAIKRLKDAGKEIPPHLAASFYLHKYLRNRKWDIVSVVRDPVARNVSAFFQNIDTYSPTYRDRELSTDPEEMVERMIREFFDHFNHDSIFHWFDIEMKGAFGFDIFSHPFDRSNGYGIYEWDGHRLLVLQFERLSQLTDVIRDFLGLPQFVLSRENVGDARDYGAIYKRFREPIRFDDVFLDRMYDNRFVRHFYSEEDIAAFRQRWSTGSPK